MMGNDEKDNLISSMGKIIDSFVMFHYLSKELQDEVDPNKLVNIFLNKVQMESTFDIHNIKIYYENDSTEEIIIEDEQIKFVKVEGSFDNLVILPHLNKEPNSINGFCVVDTLNRKRIAVCFESIRDNMDPETIKILEIYTFLFISKLENSFLQQDIKNQNEDLQLKNKELLELQSYLVQKEKLASIGQLSAGVAHELNNPIGFISGNFTALKQYNALMKDYINSSYIYFKSNNENDTIKSIMNFYEDNQLDFILEDIDSLFEESQDGLTRVTNIVKSLKDFSKIDSNGVDDSYSLNQGIESTLTILKNEYKTSANLNLNLDPSLPYIKVNGGEINEVLLNIIINSVHAIQSKYQNKMGNISISTSFNDNNVSCIIEDDGTGIPQKIIDKIFDPFFTTKPIGKGTGLGLNISYNIIVNKHKGKLHVESNEGEYTKFVIELPINSTI